MPSLLCPECGMELLPQSLASRGERVYCGQCSREIYIKTEDMPKHKCPKCEEMFREKKEITLTKCCH